MVSGFGLIGALAALGAGALIGVRHFDFVPSVTRHASSSLDRRVTMTGLCIHIGADMTVALRDLVVGNSPGGSQTEMLRIARLAPEMSPWAFLVWILADRVRKLRQVSIDGAKRESVRSFV